MILVVGGAGAGKWDYVRALGYPVEEISVGRVDDRPVVYALETVIATGELPDETLFSRLLEKKVVVCQEVGSGIVPMLPRDRETRERTGRLCCQLAREAEAVVRLVCGIPQTIKGQV